MRLWCSLIYVPPLTLALSIITILSCPLLRCEEFAASVFRECKEEGDHDDQITWKEFCQFVTHRLDKNGDGSLTTIELLAYFGLAEKPLKADESSNKDYDAMYDIVKQESKFKPSLEEMEFALDEAADEFMAVKPWKGAYVHPLKSIHVLITQKSINSLNFVLFPASPYPLNVCIRFRTAPCLFFYLNISSPPPNRTTFM